MNNRATGLIIIIAILVIVLLVYFRRKFKRIILPNVFLVTGPVKSGKTFLSLHLAIKQYKKNVRAYHIVHFFKKIVGLADDDDLPPMLYSNIPLAKVKYNPLTLDIIYRRVRIPNKSVVLIDESSLMADSMLYNDEDINNALTIFYKLFAHYSHGGYCILDTQSLKDNHFSAKRCLGSYLYIFSRIKLPFISILKVREFVSMGGDESVINNVDADVELTTRNVIIFNNTYKKYDCYAYSSFTDYLPYQCDCDVLPLRYDDDLKIYRIVTLQSFGAKMNADMNKHLKELESIENEEEN